MHFALCIVGSVHLLVERCPGYCVMYPEYNYYYVRGYCTNFYGRAKTNFSPADVETNPAEMEIIQQKTTQPTTTRSNYWYAIWDQFKNK